MEKQAIVTTIMSKLRGFKAPACPKLAKIDLTPALKGTKSPVETITRTNLLQVTSRTRKAQ